MKLHELVEPVSEAHGALCSAVLQGTGVPRDPFVLPLSTESLGSWVRRFEGLLPKEASLRPLYEAGFLRHSAGGLQAHVQLLRIHEVFSALMPALRLEDTAMSSAKLHSDLTYLVWRSFRRRHKISSPSQILPRLRRGLTAARPGGDLLELCRSMGDDHASRQYFELCLSIDSVREAQGTGLALREAWLNPEYLVTHLFGFPTSIRGFDMLFGAGLSLTEGSTGRMIIVQGPYGSLKSTLALSLAGEVARKGGVATIIALEDTMDTLRASLDAFGISDGLHVRSEDEALPANTVQGGALAVLHQSDLKRDLATLAAEIERRAEAARDRLQLIVIDPINSLVSVPGNPSRVREELMYLVDKARDKGANLLMVVEGGDESKRHGGWRRAWLDELPYLGDVVIELSVGQQPNRGQRFIEVSKSRFQREHRGLHPIAAVAGEGLRVAPAPGAFKVEAQSLAVVERAEARPTRLSFGWEAFDRLLGELNQGDMIVFQGPPGSLRTLIAMQFLVQPRSRPEPPLPVRESIFFTLSPSIPFEDRGDLASAGGSTVPIALGKLPSGFAYPGHLLGTIQEHYARARERGVCYDRAVFASGRRFDLNYPASRDDPTLGDALLDILKQEGTSTVFLCGRPDSVRASHMHRTLTERAACVVDFETVDFGGAERVLCRVARAKHEPGSRDWHEVTVVGNHRRLVPSLLRLERNTGGDSIPPNACEVETYLHLYLDEADRAQGAYLKTVKSQISSALMTPVHVEILGQPSAGKTEPPPSFSRTQLHIIQIDEFELPALKASMLHPFRCTADLAKRIGWSDLDSTTRGLMSLGAGQAHEGGDSGGYIVAVPYYKNIGLLAVKRSAPEAEAKPIDPDALGDWAEMVRLAEEGVLRFDFSRRAEENYNCLLLEMILGLEGSFPDKERGFEGLNEWILDSHFEHALSCFQVLCAPNEPSAHVANSDPHGDGHGKLEVTRQWYTNLGELAASSEQYQLFPLPRRVSVSGEWYLGVWIHSAVPEVGIRLILDELTTRQAEFRRLRQGVGLPARSAFYAGSPRDDVTTFFPCNLEVSSTVDLGGLVENAARRSEIYKYEQFAPLLLGYLRDLVGPRRPAPTDVARRLARHSRIVLEG